MISLTTFFLRAQPHPIRPDGDHDVGLCTAPPLDRGRPPAPTCARNCNSPPGRVVLVARGPGA